MNDGFGKYEVYTVFQSKYCYRDSSVLINRFGIRDPKQLKALEADITSIRQSEMLTDPVGGRFSSRQLCMIHRRLFGDIYPFAGHFRREDIQKGETRFLAYGEIPEKLKSLLTQLRAENYLSDLEKTELAEKSAYYLAELNYIHPFREGNGRTIREFMRLLYRKNRFSVFWDAVPAEQLLQAMELSVYDRARLTLVILQCISPIV